MSAPSLLRHAILAFFALCLLAPGDALAQTEAVADRIPPEQMKDVRFEGLSDAQRDLTVSILNENRCDCGCSMTLARCRRDDSTCSRSLALANEIIAQVKQGKSKEAVVKAVLEPATGNKYIQFPVTAGDAPFIGPADAKVTILHYLDYQ